MPPPSMIFHRQLEISQGYGNTGGYNEQDDSNQEENSKQLVSGMAPNGRVDVEQLDIDGTVYMDIDIDMHMDIHKYIMFANERGYQNADVGRRREE